MSERIKDRKNKLMKASQEYEDTLNDDLSELSDAASKWGTKALLIGGGIIGAYLVFKLFFSDDESSSETKVEKGYSNTSFRHIFLKSLSDKAALILLEMLREFLIKRIGDITVDDE